MLRSVRFPNNSQYFTWSSQQFVIGQLVGRASRIRERMCSCQCVEHKLSEYREARPTKTGRSCVFQAGQVYICQKRYVAYFGHPLWKREQCCMSQHNEPRNINAVNNTYLRTLRNSQEWFFPSPGKTRAISGYKYYSSLHFSQLTISGRYRPRSIAFYQQNLPVRHGLIVWFFICFARANFHALRSIFK